MLMADQQSQPPYWTVIVVMTTPYNGYTMKMVDTSVD